MLRHDRDNAAARPQFLPCEDHYDNLNLEDSATRPKRLPSAMVEDIREGPSILASTSAFALVSALPLATAALGRGRPWYIVWYYSLRDIRVV